MSWKMILREPQWWVSLLKFLNEYVYKHDILVKSVPILADVFVFSYPIYLVGLYMYGIAQKKDYYKQAALYIFFSGFGAIFVNVLIQIFVEKARPDVVLNLLHEDRDALPLNAYLPESSFPSDHAAMSMAIATASLVRGLQHKDKKFVRFSAVLGLFSIIMCLGRVMIAVHWPTDIIAGILIGICVPIIFMKKQIFSRLDRWLIQPIIRLQKWIRKKIFGHTE